MGQETLSSEKGSSSFTSLSWTRDFFSQAMLENHHHTTILSALVGIRWGDGQLTLHCPSRVTWGSSCRGIWTGTPPADHLSWERKNKRCTNYTGKTTASRAIYVFIVFIWGPFSDSEGGGSKKKTKLPSCCWSSMTPCSGKLTWKEAQLYYTLTNFLSTLGRYFKHYKKVFMK